MAIKSIHGKELFDLRNAFAFSQDSYPEQADYAGHLKDIARNHFGVNTESFTEVSDERVVKALKRADETRDKSRWEAQKGVVAGLVGMGMLATVTLPGSGMALALYSIWSLYQARRHEHNARIDMTEGLEKLGAAPKETSAVPVLKLNPAP